MVLVQSRRSTIMSKMKESNLLIKCCRETDVDSAKMCERRSHCTSIPLSHFGLVKRGTKVVNRVLHYLEIYTNVRMTHLQSQGTKIMRQFTDEDYTNQSY